jgi:hypothetical protein
LNNFIEVINFFAGILSALSGGNIINWYKNLKSEKERKKIGLLIVSELIEFKINHKNTNIENSESFEDYCKRLLNIDEWDAIKQIDSRVLTVNDQIKRWEKSINNALKYVYGYRNFLNADILNQYETIKKNRHLIIIYLNKNQKIINMRKILNDGSLINHYLYTKILRNEKKLLILKKQVIESIIYIKNEYDELINEIKKYYKL